MDRLLVDVQDMLCAQALAVVGTAMRRLVPGSHLVVRYNSDDVRRDILSWARDQGHRVSEPAPHAIHLHSSGTGT